MAPAVSVPGDGLNDRQRRFCEEYFRGEQAGNGTRAYQLAYPDAKENSASACSSALLRDPRVLKFLATLRQHALDRVDEDFKKWSDLVPEAQRVLLAVMRGNLRSRLEFDAAREILDRALGRPSQLLSHELLYDERRVQKALMAFNARTQADGPATPPGIG